VYVSASGLAALDVATGRELWQEPSISGQLVIGTGRGLYAASGTGLVALRESGWLVGPTEVTVEPAVDRATVRWRDNDTAEAGFRVELCEEGPRCAFAGSAPPNASSLAVAGLPVGSGERFFARVQAIGAAGAGTVEGTARGAPDGAPADARDRPATQAQGGRSSDFVESAWVTAVAAPAEAVLGLSARAVSSSAIEVSWSPSGDVGLLAGFSIFRGPRPEGPFTEIAFAASDEWRFVDADLSPETVYAYRVVALADGGASLPSVAAAETWPVTLEAPTELRALVGPRSISLRWQDNERRETLYVVERRAPGSSVYQAVGRLEAGATEFVDRVYLAEGHYHYRVRAVAEDAESPSAGVGVTYGGTRPSVAYLPMVTR
jgi:hypothetical protein